MLPNQFSADNTAHNSTFHQVHAANGQRIPYIGKMVHRDDENIPDEAYDTLRPGQAMSKHINIARAYEWPSDGDYYLRVKQPREGTIYPDIMDTMIKITLKNVASHQHRAAAQQAKRTALAVSMHAPTTAMASPGKLKYEGCSSKKQREIYKWHADARSHVTSAQACTTSSCTSLVRTWFGNIDQRELAYSVTSQFDEMSKRMDNSIYVCDNAAMRRICSGGYTYAFVYPVDQLQKIHLCDFTFKVRDYGEKVQTVMHELSHFNAIGGTNDEVYGEERSQELARISPSKAVKTADNVGYFGKFQKLPFCQSKAGCESRKQEGEAVPEEAMVEAMEANPDVRMAAQ